MNEFIGINPILKKVYEDKLREQMMKESALLGMMKDTMPKQKPSPYCHDYLDINVDTWFQCQLRKEHKGKHKFKSTSDVDYKVTW